MNNPDSDIPEGSAKPEQQGVRSNGNENKADPEMAGTLPLDTS